jgi:four helix bundle protein
MMERVVSRQSSVVGSPSERVGGSAAARPPQGFRDLDVYKRSMALLKPVLTLSLELPGYEKYDLASQMRRASKSIVANIAEGYALRVAPRLFCKHLRIAYGSASEMRAHFDVALELGYISSAVHEDFQGQYTIVAKQLFKLWQHWRRTLGVIEEDDH